MPDNIKTRRSGWAIATKLIVLVKPMLPVMLAAITMGTAGFLCAIFLTVFGGYALLNGLGFAVPFSLSFLFISMAVFAVMRGLLRYAEQAANHYIAFKLLALIRDKVFRALRRLAPAKLESREKGNLITVITTDIELLEVFYAHTISPVAIAVLVCAAMTAYLWSFHWVFALIAMVAYVTVGVLLPLFISRLGAASGMAYRNQNGILGSVLLDGLRGLREILQFGQGQNRLDSIQSHTLILSEKQKQLKKYEGLGTALGNTAIIFFSVSIFFVGLLLQQAGIIDFSALLLAFIAMISSFGPVVALANLSNNLVQTFASADRVLDLLEEAPQTEEITQGLDVTFDNMSCDDISFAYEEQPVLQDFSLAIPQNEIIGIQGKSGTGKSTILRLLMRFWDVNRGSITMSGHDVKTINTSSLRHNQSFVTQETVLFNDTLENNIKVANLNATRQQVEYACKKASIHDFIVSLPNGYDTMAGELGSSLSGGERQRIGLARAFLHDAPMILLDEPTSNLDSLNEGVILQSLTEESAGKTIVIVSHRASSLSIADRVVSVKHGA